MLLLTVLYTIKGVLRDAFEKERQNTYVHAHDGAKVRAAIRANSGARVAGVDKGSHLMMWMLQ